MNTRRTRVLVKDPDSVLDYRVDWSAWLPPGDLLLDAQWITTGALGVEQSAISDTAAVAWLSGASTEGTRNTVANRITTAAGRTEDFSFIIVSREN